MVSAEKGNGENVELHRRLGMVKLGVKTVDVVVGLRSGPLANYVGRDEGNVIHANAGATCTKWRGNCTWSPKKEMKRATNKVCRVGSGLGVRLSHEEKWRVGAQPQLCLKLRPPILDVLIAMDWVQSMDGREKVKCAPISRYCLEREKGGRSRVRDAGRGQRGVRRSRKSCSMHGEFLFFGWQRRRNDSWRVTWHDGIGEVLWVVYVAGVKRAHPRVAAQRRPVWQVGHSVGGAQQRGNGQVCVKGAQVVEQASGLPAIWTKPGETTHQGSKHRNQHQTSEQIM